MDRIQEEHWKRRVYDTFQTIAAGYDRANTRISLGMQGRWKAELIRRVAADTPSGTAVLDVCCGTGDIAIGIAARRPDLRVYGLDFSPAMLDAARKKSGQRENVLFRLGDAAALPYADGAFAAACISFGLRNTPDREQTLREMGRVVRAGGWVYCLDSFVPERRWTLPFYRLYFRYGMPLLGGGFRRRREYQWLYESTRDFLRGEELRELFVRTGFRETQSREYLFGACLLLRGKNGEREGNQGGDYG